MAENENASCGARCQSRLSAFGKFMCNMEEGTFIGRTPKSWGLIIIFYIIYYSLLAAFFVGMLSVLLYGIVTDEIPMQTGDHSILKMNPGLGARPQPDVTTTLIQYSLKDISTAKPYIDNLQSLYDQMKNSTGKNCTLTNPEANKDYDPKKEFCKKDPQQMWGDCSKSPFGYDKNGQPCVIVKMNKIYGWLPDIQNASISNHSLLLCEGDNDGDRATIGDVDYYPGVKVNGVKYGYFSSALFPYVNQKNFGAFAVAVRFRTIRRNVLVMVSCQLRNLNNAIYDKNDRQAMVRFELAIMTK